MPDTLTLYANMACPYAQRVDIALKEAKADYTRYEVDLQNKPAWYAPQVNPASKVPAIAYGGPKVPPDQPSPESAKLAESLVLLEFVADIYPDADLLPTDPVQRAKVRFFIDAVSTKTVPAATMFLRNLGPGEPLVHGIETLQALLPTTGFAFGEFSLADIVVAPFIARLHIVASNFADVYSKEDAARLLSIFQAPEFARFQQYWKDLQAHPSFSATFDEAAITEVFGKGFAALSRQK
ncbi:hypothetical protein B0H21DRAFT_823736 [Amylocystis lapponica]|nr:hypothetical protein B0H21DRAFT_823736 [Amylocystis lapponica]